MWPTHIPITAVPEVHGLQAVLPSWPQHMPSQAAAVLALFIPGPSPDSPLELLFTKRSQLVRTHKGQIGFPGGRRELGDSSPVATALREAHEEIGLALDKVSIIGSLPPVKSLDLQPVLPLLAFADIALCDLRASEHEVAEIFTVPWPMLVKEAAQRVRFNIFGLWRDTAVYEIGPHCIWGLTAKMISLADLRARSS